LLHGLPELGALLGSRPGIDPKSVQGLMRHSTPDLTFRIYVHADMARLRAAVDAVAKLAEPPGAAPSAAHKLA